MSLLRCYGYGRVEEREGTLTSTDALLARVRHGLRLKKQLLHRIRAKTTCNARLRGVRAGRRCLASRTRHGRCRAHGGHSRGPVSPEGRIIALANLVQFQDPEVFAAYLRRTDSPQVKRAATESYEGSDQIHGQTCRKRKPNEAVVSRTSRDAVPVDVGVRNDRASQRNLGSLGAGPVEYEEQQP